MSDTLIKNMTLLSQNTLNGFGGIGEGMSMQVTRDERRIIWLAHEVQYLIQELTTTTFPSDIALSNKSLLYVVSFPIAFALNSNTKQINTKNFFIVLKIR